MTVPSPLLWAVRSVSEVIVLYHPTAEACSSDGRCQDSQTLPTSARTASEQGKKDLCWIGEGSQLIGDVAELMLI